MNSKLIPDSQRFEKFVSGQSPLGNGRFWLVNLLKFKPNGLELYKQYEAAAAPLMRAVGARPVFRLYHHVRTVIDGGGTVPDWDGVLIGEYPSTDAFRRFSTSPEYRKAHKLRVAALEATEMHACDGSWANQLVSGLSHAKPNLALPVPTVRKTKRQMAAIMGDREKVQEYLQDERFASGRVWMINLLRYEPGPGKALYAEYGARAASHIGSLKEGSGGGLQAKCDTVYTLLGPEYDGFMIMQYPSRDAFAQYSTGQASSGLSPKDTFAFRIAGLAVQALISLGPESDPSAVADPNGPKIQPTAVSKL